MAKRRLYLRDTRPPMLESEVCDMKRRIASLIEFFHGHDTNGLTAERYGQVGTMLVDLEHGADRLDEAFYEDPPGTPTATHLKHCSVFDLEDIVTDAMSGVRVLHIVESEAADSPAHDTPSGRKMTVDEDTFIAWMHACDRLSDTVRELSRVFHGEPKR